MASNSDAVEGKYAYEKTVTGWVVAGAAGGIGCGMERSGVFDGWENGRPKGGRVRLEKRRGASGAPESPTPTAYVTPLPYRLNRHDRRGCAQIKNMIIFVTAEDITQWVLSSINEQETATMKS